MQLRIAKRVKGPLSVILIAQVVFWSLAYVARPTYLLIARPTTTDELADSRMMGAGYAEALMNVLSLVCVGQLAFTVAVVLTLALLPRRRTTFSPVTEGEPRALVYAAFAFWCVGWLFRLPVAEEFEGLASIARSFAPIGGGMLILLVRDRRNSAFPLVLIPVLLGEVVTALGEGSKTALIVPALALVLRWNRRGVPHLKRRLALLGSLVLIGFLIIQPLKGIDTAERVEAVNPGPLGKIQAQSVALIERFDGVSAVQDALAHGPDNWLSVPALLSRSVSYVVPGLSEDVTLGQRWTREIRTSSIPHQYQDVSLAAGPTAEGYALGGWPGVLLESGMMGIATVLLGLAMASRRPYLLLIACVFIFSTTLFELGMLGMLQRVNRIILLSAVLLLILPFTRSFDRFFRENASVRASGAGTVDREQTGERISG
ncbi:hypothetical protein [Curtobacterium sp. BRD11]|uniref:hypothetical protein n=1 Tax=Curtobacterium sp. BRD11 TaxID=2962581 RepID=UPI002881654B|nr:hypothetical protein [Curtobacterium sp. BRD11]MDT0211476.1 hypothetical protein [Curtobacterium sp. BRD11]